MKKNNSCKSWKKTKRQRRLAKTILWKVKLSPEAASDLKKYCLKNNISIETGFIRIMKEYVKQDLTNT